MPRLTHLILRLHYFTARNRLHERQLQQQGFHPLHIQSRRVVRVVIHRLGNLHLTVLDKLAVVQVAQIRRNAEIAAQILSRQRALTCPLCCLPSKHSGRAKIARIYTTGNTPLFACSFPPAKGNKYCVFGALPLHEQQVSLRKTGTAGVSKGLFPTNCRIKDKACYNRHTGDQPGMWFGDKAVLELCVFSHLSLLIIVLAEFK